MKISESSRAVRLRELIGLFLKLGVIGFGNTGTSVFLPHGIGHMLGLQVHDVAGKQAEPAGAAIPPNPHVRFRYLRAYRALEPGFLFTVEPGIYFIDILLDEARKDARAKHIVWTQIERYLPYGGVRIEDNVFVTANGHENLTRAQLPRWNGAGADRR